VGCRSTTERSDRPSTAFRVNAADISQAENGYCDVSLFRLGA
jgi:hypothetical protein